MKLKDFEKHAAAFYLAGTRDPENRESVYLRSAPGRGKTTVIRNLIPKMAAELKMNLGFVKIEAPLLTPVDAAGYLMPQTLPDGRLKSLYTDPFWWETTEGKTLGEYDGGIIFIDEADKADTDVKKILGEMALSGRCGPHQIPRGWVVWMAGNRAGDRSGSTKELDHLINRRTEIDVTDDVEGWKDWAFKNGVHHSIIAFTASNPHIVFPDALPDKQGPFCTPRSITNLSHMLVTLGGNDPSQPLPDTEIALEIAAGKIGHAAAAQLFATIKLEHELPSIEDIVKDPKKAKLPSDPGAQMLVCYKLASVATHEVVAPFVEYVSQLTADFSITFVSSLCKRDPMFVTNPAMMDWCKKNSALMAVITAAK